MFDGSRFLSFGFAFSVCCGFGAAEIIFQSASPKIIFNLQFSILIKLHSEAVE